MRSKIPLLIFITIVLAGVGYPLEGEDNSIIIDTMSSCEFGWNETTTTFSSGCMDYEFTQLGAVRLWQNGYLVGASGYGYSADVVGFHDVSEMTWTWWLDGNDVIGYNNLAEFPIYQYYTFVEGQPVKIRTTLENKFRPPITFTNFKVWYLHTLEEGQMITYNDTEYIVQNDSNIYIHGNFNDILPEVDFGGLYVWDYKDLVENWEITDILIGDGGLINSAAEGIKIMAVGVTDDSGGVIPYKGKWELDPTIETVAVQWSTRRPNINSVMYLGMNGSEPIYHGTYVNASGVYFAEFNGSAVRKKVLVTSISGLTRAGNSGLMRDSNGIIYDYYMFTNVAPAIGRMKNSTDNGTTWGTEYLTLNTTLPAGGLRVVSCAIDGNDEKHCSSIGSLDGVNDNELWYGNSSDGWAEHLVANNSVYESTDIEIGYDGEVYIGATEASQNKTWLWRNSDGWGVDFRNELCNISNGDGAGIGMAMGIDNHNNIFVAVPDNNGSVPPPIKLCYARRGNLSDIGETWVRNSAGAVQHGYFPTLATEDCRVFVSYQTNRLSRTGDGFIVWVDHLNNMTDWVGAVPVAPTATGSGWVNLADSTYPTINKDSCHNIVDERPSILALFTTYIVTIYNVEFLTAFSTGDICQYPEGFWTDWELNKHCQISAVEETVYPYEVIITENGRLNITNGANVSASGYDLNGTGWSIELNESSLDFFELIA